MKRIGVLISGRGSNLQALIDAASRQELGGEIAIVISNTEKAAGLERARKAGIAAVFQPQGDHSREDYDQQLVERLREHRVDLVCLAGYMRILSSRFIDAFRGRTLNIHPSLLPAFPGPHAQEQALRQGVKVTGVTVHVVDEGLDSGPIVLQEAVPVEDGDDFSRLAARILEAEHRIYPKAVRLVLDGEPCLLEHRPIAGPPGRLDKAR